MPMNVDGGRNCELEFILHKKIGGFDAGINTNLSYTRNVNYIGADLNRNDNYSSSEGFRLNRYVADKYSIQLNTGFSYFSTRSSVNTNAPVHYWSQNNSGQVSLLFIRGVEINTNANYSWQQKTSSFDKNTSVLIWNASIGHNFISGKWVAKLLVNNIGNQTAGFIRSNIGNINTESSTNILGRYWLISLAYRFDHKFRSRPN